MAASVVYTTFNGMIVHENRDGTERDYMPDPLGSTAALLDNSQTKTDTWDYWPNGEVITRTGSNATPFTFVGVSGYFKDVLDKLMYVRARFLQLNMGRWLTVDRLWPSSSAYGYCGSSPATRTDKYGLRPQRDAYKDFSTPGPLPFPYPLNRPPCFPFESPKPDAPCSEWNDFIWQYCNDCHAGKLSLLLGNCYARCSDLAQWYYQNCKSPGRSPRPFETWKPGQPFPWGPGPIIPFPFVPPPSPDTRSDRMKDYDECMRQADTAWEEFVCWLRYAGDVFFEEGF